MKNKNRYLATVLCIFATLYGLPACEDVDIYLSPNAEKVSRYEEIYTGMTEDKFLSIAKFKFKLVGHAKFGDEGLSWSQKYGEDWVEVFESANSQSTDFLKESGWTYPGDEIRDSMYAFIDPKDIRGRMVYVYIEGGRVVNMYVGYS